MDYGYGETEAPETIEESQPEVGLLKYLKLQKSGAFIPFNDETLTNFTIPT